MSVPVLSPDGKWHYLVVFDLNFDHGVRGIGNGEVVLDDPISTYQPITQLQDTLSLQHGATAVVTDLITLSGPAVSSTAVTGAVA